MSPRSTFLGWLAAALLAASVAHAEGARIAGASAPPDVTRATRHSFEKAIERDVEAQTERVPEGYTLEPRLLELRRYTDGDPKRPMFVCVAELDLVEDSDGRVIAHARASATSTTANEHAVVDAAADAVTTRVAATLRALARAQRDQKAPVASR